MLPKDSTVFRDSFPFLGRVALILFSTPLFSTGCCTSSHADRGALVGSGMGALTGAVLAGGHPLEGALVGGLVGAAAGTVIGDAEDAREERDAALMHAARVETAAALGLTNHDILKMTANGLGEEVVITSIQSRGGRFDVSPDSLISLKSAGVTDRVIQAMQASGGAISPLPVAPSLVAVPTGPPLVIQPRPAVEFGLFVGPGGPFGPRFHHPHRHHHPPHHHHW